MKNNLGVSPIPRLSVSPFRVMQQFWRGKRVLITGHTGFKGSWLCMWLSEMGADVTGYALRPPTKPSLFETAKVARGLNNNIADIRDLKKLKKVFTMVRPEIVFHMAAQPLVLESYKDPVGTYSTNVMGTVNLLEAVRATDSARAVVNVTTDKCYENRERLEGYREDEAMGGFDPYSSSKGCSELVTAAYRRSFFTHCSVSPSSRLTVSPIALATARAGNVIGGGDWADDRIVPDCIRALSKGQIVKVRNPKSVRPWQHVLEPLSGYLLLAEKLYRKGHDFAGPWNFGPDPSDEKPVGSLVEHLCSAWGDGAKYSVSRIKQPHEAFYLRLNCSKAGSKLGWRPVWHLKKAVEKIVEWAKACEKGEDMRIFSIRQIHEYCADHAQKVP